MHIAKSQSFRQAELEKLRRRLLQKIVANEARRKATSKPAPK